MALPAVAIVEPLLRIPRVAKDSLSVELLGTGSPAITTFGFRMYEFGTTPPPWRVKETAAVDPVVRANFIQFDLVAGTTYTIEAYAENDDGAENAASALITWNPETDLYPPPDLNYGSSVRPWAWEEYLENWLEQLPPYYREEPFVLGLLGSIAEEFQRLAAAIEQVERFVLPSRTYGEGLATWERLLGIRPPASLSEDRRRAAVLAHLRGRVDPSAALFEESLELIVGEDINIRENFNAFEVTIDTRGDPDLTELVREIVERLMPAHLVPVFAPAVLLLDYRERRAPIIGLWPRGRATTRPSGTVVGGFDLGGLD